LTGKKLAGKMMRNTVMKSELKVRCFPLGVMGELTLIFAVCLLGEVAAALLPVAFPASVISMIVLMFFLLCGVVKERQIQVVAKFLVANMGIFFVPAVVGTMEYTQVLSRQLLPFLVMVAVTTPVVYGVTAWTVQLLMRGRKGENKNV
jgi:holin-like protein